MLRLSFSATIWLSLAPTDIRKSFDTLSAIVREQLGEYSLSGSLFVFRSRRQDRVKLLSWDLDGYSQWARHLVKGTFQFPSEPGDARA